MDKKIIIANWKSNKNSNDASEFIKGFSQNYNRLNMDNKEIILAPPFTLLAFCKSLVEKYNLPIKIASQDVSPFPSGAYTGAVSALQLSEFATMCIIGHSERRELFSETDEILNKKVSEAKENGLDIIYCVQNGSQKIPNGVNIVAYEPVSAIGTGNPDDASHVEEVFSEIRKNFSGKILYGGSINSDNVRNYIHINNCFGLLVGGASLEINSFINLLTQW